MEVSQGLSPVFILPQVFEWPAVKDPHSGRTGTSSFNLQNFSHCCPVAGAFGGLSGCYDGLDFIKISSSTFCIVLGGFGNDVYLESLSLHALQRRCLCLTEEVPGCQEVCLVSYTGFTDGSQLLSHRPAQYSSRAGIALRSAFSQGTEPPAGRR